MAFNHIPIYYIPCNYLLLNIIQVVYACMKEIIIFYSNAGIIKSGNKSMYVCTSLIYGLMVNAHSDTLMQPDGMNTNGSGVYGQTAAKAAVMCSSRTQYYSIVPCLPTIATHQYTRI